MLTLDCTKVMSESVLVPQVQSQARLLLVMTSSAV